MRKKHQQLKVHADRSTRDLGYCKETTECNEVIECYRSKAKKPISKSPNEPPIIDICISDNEAECGADNSSDSENSIVECTPNSGTADLTFEDEEAFFHSLLDLS